MTTDQMYQFQETVWEYYRQHGRDLPWRHEPHDAYAILVSEVMLQQTQVSRVIPKYQAFLMQFPSPQALARSPLDAVIKAWSGLGYNRRAKYLHDAAKQLAPKSTWTLADLTVCKGIGFNTAAAVRAYAYNEPLVFIETNIRTVYIHHFFADQEQVNDAALLPLIKQTLDHEHPREFYWALMDYGSYLKSTVGNVSRLSRHYTKQSAFDGSIRQLRGQVLRILGADKQTLDHLRTVLKDERLPAVLADLTHEGLIIQQQRYYRLPG